LEFIFMLTREDRTVDDALAVYGEVAGTDLSLVGFKDVGASGETLGALTDAMHEDGRTVFLEVVSTSRDDELRSVEAALACGVDYVMGGTHVDDVLPLLAGSSVRYCPFPGTVVGHPSRLRGSIDDIAADAARLTVMPGVEGVDLLAYRHDEVDPPDLVDAVVRAATGPVIVAGSIDGEERIKAMAARGAWAFTVGSAIFAGMLPGAPSIPAQVQWAVDMARS
jgi:hypothetical protein